METSNEKRTCENCRYFLVKDDSNYCGLTNEETDDYMEACEDFYEKA